MFTHFKMAKKTIQNLSFIEIAQNIIKDACIRKKLDWVIVDKFLWLTGSLGRVDELALRMRS